jgi:hypothetical protein
VGEKVETHKLCGKIFRQSNPGTGSCSASLYNTSTFIWVGFAGFLWFVAAVGACNFLGISSGFLVAGILIFFLAATLCTVPIPLAQGVKQFDVSPTDIIAFVQSLTAAIYCYAWFYMARKAKKEEPIFEAGEQQDEGVLKEDATPASSKSMRKSQEPIFQDDDAVKDSQ